MVPARGPTRLAIAINNVSFLWSHRREVVFIARQLGWNVLIVAPRPESERQIAAWAAFKASGAELEELVLSRAGVAPLELFQSAAALTRIYRRWRPDIVHHVTPKVVTLGSFAARLACVPAVVNAISGLGFMFAGRGTAASLRRSAATLLYGSALRHSNQAVLVQNEQDLEVMRRLRLPESTIFRKLRGSGVDLSTFRPAESLANDQIVVLPARLLRSKGVMEFAAAARLLRERGVGARMTLCGEVDPGNPDSLTQSELDALVDAGVVEWLGHRDDMQSVYASATIACLPSYREGLPLALAEAAACGLPIVTTDVPGCRETLVPDISGVLVPARDAPALADAIQRILKDERAASVMGRESREFAELHFSKEAIVASHFETYQLLMSRRA